MHSISFSHSPKLLHLTTSSNYNHGYADAKHPVLTISNHNGWKRSIKIIGELKLISTAQVLGCPTSALSLWSLPLERLICRTPWLLLTWRVQPRLASLNTVPYIICGIGYGVLQPASHMRNSFLNFRTKNGLLRSAVVSGLVDFTGSFPRFDIVYNTGVPYLDRYTYEMFAAPLGMKRYGPLALNHYCWLITL